ncbi:MAG: four helix bundle protein [Terriglobales bacterium]|jgi:four helix bundle protein
MKSFRDLTLWEKAHALTLASYRDTAEFPKQEVYGLTSQIRRCSASNRRQYRRGLRET